MAIKTPLVCVDRDGTINKDENYYLGSSPNWKSQLEILPGVVQGIRLLNSAHIKPFIVTNQSGTALGFFDEARMKEVNEYLIEMLRKEGALVQGYEACPYIDLAYAEKARAKGKIVLEQYVQNDCPDLKPRIGMLKKAAAKLGKTIEDCAVTVIGDRYSDIEMALNANGRGILVASCKTKELGDIEKFQLLAKKLSKEGYPNLVYLTKDFYEAAKIAVTNF